MTCRIAVMGFALALLMGCGESGGKPATGRPPAAPPPLELPAEMVAALPKDDQGRTILFDMPLGSPDGEHAGLVYDPTQDDEIARWAHCLERVGACYQSNAPSPIAGCVDQIPLCASAAGGAACCPLACVQTFRTLRASMSEDQAVDASFLAGDCIPGFAARRDQARAAVAP